MAKKLKLYNTLSRKVEEFIPLNPPHVGMYTCGPTVYDYTHIGHLRTYVGNDILRRTLEANNFEVQHVMNITDVGHLTSDADEGDDKLEKGAKEKGQTVWEVAKLFTDYFFKSMDQVNVKRPHIVVKATEHINEQIKLIEKLEKNGLIYQTEEAIYFDTAKFPNYGKLSRQNLKEQIVGAREEVRVDPHKKNPADFALWFFTVGRFEDHSMRWSSPWGEGFPGWHIECSAMSMEYLGNSFDIHTGGVDHIPVHHENEIAQSQGATGQPFVKYWLHHEFILVDGEKMSKSKKNFYTIDDVKDKGFDPLAFRYLCLTAHYRDKLNFTWESLQAAQNALDNLRDLVREYDQPQTGNTEYEKKFFAAANKDLNMPQAMAVMWEMVKNNPSGEILLKMDQVLGLDLERYLGKPLEVPPEVRELVKKREHVRKSGDFKKADEIRKEIKKLGYNIEDTPSGPKILCFKKLL